jgi:hypothetical protein
LLSEVKNLDEKTIGHLLVFPNPASEVIQMAWEEAVFPFEINIFNQFGQMVQRDFIQNKKQLIEVNQLNSGIYWISIPKKRVVGKFIKI